MKFEHTKVMNFDGAFRGMRNPMNSWDRSDSRSGVEVNFAGDAEQPVISGYREVFQIGKADLELAQKLIAGGSPHRKFLRQILVSVDITGSLFWWKEFDTYKVGTVANSCSTMHKIHAKEFTLDDFSCEHLMQFEVFIFALPFLMIIVFCGQDLAHSPQPRQSGVAYGLGMKNLPNLP